MPGPPPSRNPRRRSHRPDWQQLPRAGRVGDTPAWPLTRASAREAQLWVQLWASPQAVAWERLGWTRTVARYCRIATAAESRGARGTFMAEARQLEDRLGLNAMSLKRLLWEIVDEPSSDAESIDLGDADGTGPVDLEAFRARLSG